MNIFRSTWVKTFPIMSSLRNICWIFTEDVWSLDIDRYCNSRTTLSYFVLSLLSPDILLALWSVLCRTDDKRCIEKLDTTVNTKNQVPTYLSIKKLIGRSRSPLVCLKISLMCQPHECYPRQLDYSLALSAVLLFMVVATCYFEVGTLEGQLDHHEVRCCSIRFCN